MYLHIAHLIWTPKDEPWGILNDDSKKVRLIDSGASYSDNYSDDYPCNIVKYQNKIYLCVNQIVTNKIMSPTDDFPISEFITSISSYAYVLAFGYTPN